jgi:hypothetical protein
LKEYFRGHLQFIDQNVLIAVILKEMEVYRKVLSTHFYPDLGEELRKSFTPLVTSVGLFLFEHHLMEQYGRRNDIYVTSTLQQAIERRRQYGTRAQMDKINELLPKKFNFDSKLRF